MKEGGQLEADPAIVQGIVGMGFGENAAKRAVCVGLHHKHGLSHSEADSEETDLDICNNAASLQCLATKNAPLDATMEWLFAHLDDADLNLPLPDTSSNAGGGGNGTHPALSNDEILMAMKL